MSRAFIARWCSVLAVLAVTGCGSAPPKPVATKLEIVASADINPDPAGRPSPLVMRFFQLRTDAEFAGAQYFQLYDHEKEVLGASLISRDEFPLSPGAHALQELPVSADARFFGVLAGYRDSAAQWRALIPVPGKSIKGILKEQRVTVRLNKAAVAITVNE